MLIGEWIKGKSLEKRTKNKGKSSSEKRIVKLSDGTVCCNANRTGDEFSPHPYEPQPFPWLKDKIDIIRTKYGVIRPVFDDEEIRAYRFTFSERCVKDTGVLARYYFGKNIANANQLGKRSERLRFRKFHKEDDFLESAWAIEYLLHSPMIDILNSNNGLASLRNLEVYANEIKERLDENKWEKTKSYFPRFMEMIAVSLLVRNATQEDASNENHIVLGLKRTHYGGVPMIGTDVYHPGIIDLETGKAEREPTLQNNSAFLGLVAKRRIRESAKDLEYVV